MMMNDKSVGLATNRLQVQFSAVALLRNSAEQIVHNLCLTPWKSRSSRRYRNTFKFEFNVTYHQRRCCGHRRWHSKRRGSGSNRRRASLNRRTVGRRLGTDRLRRCTWRLLSPRWQSWSSLCVSLLWWSSLLPWEHTLNSTGSADLALNSPDRWILYTSWRGLRTRSLQQHMNTVCQSVINQ